MKLNKQIIALADECARKVGYFCASYLGRKDDEFIFATRYADSMERTEGLPALVIVRNMQARFVMDIESFTYLNDLKFRDYKRGHTIYCEFEQKYDQDDFANKEEREYIGSIVENQRSDNESAISKDTLYDYLEIAERFNLKLKLKAEKWQMGGKDVLEYYLELKKYKHEGYKNHKRGV